jgi:hypothetical protein
LSGTKHSSFIPFTIRDKEKSLHSYSLKNYFLSVALHQNKLECLFHKSFVLAGLIFESKALKILDWPPTTSNPLAYFSSNIGGKEQILITQT